MDFLNDFQVHKHQIHDLPIVVLPNLIVRVVPDVLTNSRHHWLFDYDVKLLKIKHFGQSLEQVLFTLKVFNLLLFNITRFCDDLLYWKLLFNQIFGTVKP